MNVVVHACARLGRCRRTKTRPASPQGGTVKLSELMAFHAAVDELFRSYRCRSVYLDVGSNIGVQIRKLYEPEKYPAAPALRIFDDVFGRDRCDVCTIGIEPNPHHTARLTDLERRYRATGLPVLVLIAAASDAESRTQLIWQCGRCGISKGITMNTPLCYMDIK